MSKIILQPQIGESATADFEENKIYFDRDMYGRLYKIHTEENWETEPIIVDCMYCENLSEWLPLAIEKATEIFNNL